MISPPAMKPRITLLDGKKLSSACAAGGVFMLVLASLLPSRWHPVAFLFAGLALIAVSHLLTPCQDQITRWWRARLSKSSPDRT